MRRVFLRRREALVCRGRASPRRSRARCAAPASFRLETRSYRRRALESRSGRRVRASGRPMKWPPGASFALPSRRRGRRGACPRAFRRTSGAAFPSSTTDRTCFDAPSGLGSRSKGAARAYLLTPGSRVKGPRFARPFRATSRTRAAGMDPDRAHARGRRRARRRNASLRSTLCEALRRAEAGGSGRSARLEARCANPSIALGTRDRASGAGEVQRVHRSFPGVEGGVGDAASARPVGGWGLDRP